MPHPTPGCFVSSLPLDSCEEGPSAGPSCSFGFEPLDALSFHRDESTPSAPAPQALGYDWSPAASWACPGLGELEISVCGGEGPPESNSYEAGSLLG